MASSLTNVPPPSELPSFITSPMPIPNKTTSSPQTTIQDTSQEGHPNSQMQQTSLPLHGKPQVSTQSVANVPKQEISIVAPPSTSFAPVTNQPIAPTRSTESTQVKINKLSLEDNAAELPSEGNGWLGWIKGTVQNVGSRVAEKAKTSMDTMITTLDPQMKDFINSGGDIDIVVASDKEVKISPVREAFQKVFGKASVNGFDSQANDVAPQTVGFENALKSAEERINNLRSSGKIHPQQPMISVENFIVEFLPEEWFELGLLLLDDPWHDIILQTYTQVTPVPLTFIEKIKEATPADYPLKASGFSKTVGQTAAENLQVSHTMWQETLTGVSRREMILLAARTLAGLYKSRLPSDVI